jgi:hypothetical protein
MAFLAPATAAAALNAIVASSSNVALSLHVSNPGTTGAGEEVGTGYSYQTVQFGAATVANPSVKTGPNATASFTATSWTASAPLGWFGVWDPTHTTWQCGGALSATLQPPPSCTVVVLAAGISLTESG